MKRWILCFLILALLCAIPVPAFPEEVFCATEEEYLAALIAAKQSAEPRSFVSFEIRVSEELLDALYADNYALQHQLADHLLALTCRSQCTNNLCFSHSYSAPLVCVY